MAGIGRSLALWIAMAERPVRESVRRGIISDGPRLPAAHLRARIRMPYSDPGRRPQRRSDAISARAPPAARGPDLSSKLTAVPEFSYAGRTSDGRYLTLLC